MPFISSSNPSRPARFASSRLSRSFAPAALVALTSVAAACSSPRPDDIATASSAATAGFSAEAEARWNAYVARVTTGASLQRGCEPTRFSPPAGVTARGAVVLFHGFSACPQQYFELVGLLTAEGFEVLLPLSPGHGRVPLRSEDGTIHDDLRDLPNGYTKARYTELAHEMNEMMRATSGTRIVGGLSLGGAIATRALLDAPGLYDRGFLLSPFYTIPGVQGWLAKAANVLIPSKDAGWGPNCVAEREQPNPRAGICEFQVQHVRGAAEFGEQVAAQARSLTMPLQVTGVEGDTAADNGLTMKVVRAASQATLCFYEKGVNHSLLSRFDSPTENKYWVPSALEQITSFVVDARRFVTAGVSSEGGYPFCSVR